MASTDLDPSAPARLDWPEDRPHLLPLAPLIHAAWADGVLTPAELKGLWSLIEDRSLVEGDDRIAAEAWLNPENPPSPESLSRLGRMIEHRGREAPEEARSSLADLGLALARMATRDDGASEAGGEEGDVPEPWRSGDARAALREMEEALGMAGPEAVRSVLSPSARGAPSPAAPSERGGADRSVFGEGEEREPAPEPTPFDPEALRNLLDQPHADLRRHVLEILARPELQFPHDIGGSDYRDGVLDALRILADEGLGGLAYPVRFGGAGSPGRMVAAFETLAFGDLSVLVKFGVQFGLFGGSVYQLGTRRHHERYLKDIASLELPGCYAMTEMAHGSNVRDLETTATYDPDDDVFVIDTPHPGARKDWIGNAALHGRMATVFARLVVRGEDHGVHALLVPIRDGTGTPLPGIEIEDRGPKQGLNGVDNGILGFDQVTVPRGNLLDRFGSVSEDGHYESPIPSPGRRFFTMLGTLVGGRISIGAASVSAAKTGLTIAVRYSDRRRQFGPSGEGEVPVLDYLTQQRLLLPRLATTYALHFAVRDLVDRYEESQVKPHEPGAREVEVLAAGLKAYASRHCVETLQACREACGGRGYLAANRFGRLKADTDVFTTFEGANVVLLQLVAKGLLSEYREEMGDLRLWGAVRWVADRAQTRVTELNPVATRRTDEEHLRDPDFHRAAFEYREERLLASAGARLKALIDDGVDTFEAMNTCQDHLVTLARAHVERHLLQCFRAAVERVRTGEDGGPGEDQQQGEGGAHGGDAAPSEALDNLATLFALERMERHRGWYLESGYFAGAKAKAVRDQVNALCREIRPAARPLVDAFGIPDEVLRAPDGVERGPAV